MKNIILTLAISFMCGWAAAQISNVKADGKHLYIYNTEGRKISDFYCYGSFFGYSTSLIGTADGKHIYVYNESGRKISDFYCYGSPVNVSGNNIISKDVKHVYVYNSDGKKISDYYER